jgi:hypothetical protein
VLELLAWFLAFVLILWLAMSLLERRVVNPLRVALGAILAPPAFLLGLVAALVALALSAALLPALAILALPVALLSGFLLSLATLSLIAGVDPLRALLALIIALAALALIGALVWHEPEPVPPAVPLPLHA